MPPDELIASKAQVPEAWTQEEDSRILQGVATHGFKWKKIAQDIPGRSGDAVRNRYQRLKAAAATGVHESLGAEPPPVDVSAVAVASTAASSSASAVMPPPPAKAAAFATAIPLAAGCSKQLGPVSSQPVPEPPSANGGAVLSMAEITESMTSIGSGGSSSICSAPAARPSLKNFSQAAASSWSALPEGLVQATAVPQPPHQQQTPQPPQPPPQPQRPPQVPVSAPMPAAASASAPAPAMNRLLPTQPNNSPSVLSPSDPFAQMLAAAVPSVLKPGTRFQPTGHIVSSLADDLDFDSSSSSLESHSRSRSKTNFFDRSR